MNKYSCYWGEGYGNNKGTVELHTIDWFHENIGYDAAAIKAIKQLEIGETADLTDLSGQHSVTRVE